MFLIVGNDVLLSFGRRLTRIIDRHSRFRRDAPFTRHDILCKTDQNKMLRFTIAGDIRFSSRDV